MQEKDYQCRKNGMFKKEQYLSKFFNITTTFYLFNVHFWQIYVVRVLREGQAEPTFVFRTFDEFQELHNKLGILFPLWKLPGYVSHSFITIIMNSVKNDPSQGGVKDS